MPSYKRKVSIPGKSSQELYDTISTAIERLMEKASVGKVEIDRDPSKKEVRVKSAMISATLCCNDECLHVEGQLSLLATPFRAKIDEGIDQWVSRTFSNKKA